MTTRVIYLLHFDRPFGQARHYMGSAVQLEQRLAEHRNGNGARLMFWVAQAGISWRLARTWAGGRQRERQLKVQGGHFAPLPDLSSASTAGKMPLVIDVLPVGSPVRCACSRSLIAERITGHITRRPNGGIHFPPAARHTALQVDHRVDCSAAGNHQHYNVGVRDEADSTQIYRCSISSLERTNIEIAAEIRARSQTRAAS